MVDRPGRKRTPPADGAYVLDQDVTVNGPMDAHTLGCTTGSLPTTNPRHTEGAPKVRLAPLAAAVMDYHGTCDFMIS